MLATGTGSVIDLSSLSSIATPLSASSLTAQSGGTILLNASAFLLQNTAINMIGSPLLPATLSAGPNLTLYGRAWHSYWIDRLDTRQPDNSWQLFARVPLTNAVMVVSGAPKSWQAFRAYEFVAEPPILDIARTGPLAARLVVYGQTNRSIAVETTPSLDVLPAPWLPTGLGTGPMTNTFRIFPTFPATEAKRFYRARQLP